MPFVSSPVQKELVSAGLSMVSRVAPSSEKGQVSVLLAFQEEDRIIMTNSQTKLHFANLFRDITHMDCENN